MNKFKIQKQKKINKVKTYILSFKEIEIENKAYCQLSLKN